MLARLDIAEKVAVVQVSVSIPRKRVS